MTIDLAQLSGSASAPDVSVPSRVAPGRATVTQRLPASRTAAPAHPIAPAAPPVPLASPDRVDDPFGFHLLRSADDDSDTEAVAVEIPRGEQAGGPEPTGGQPVAPTGEPAPGEEASTTLGDLPAEPMISNQDKVSPSISFTGAITQGGVALTATEFGKCVSLPTLKNITLTRRKGAIKVTADYELKTTWDTMKGTGPSSQVNLADEDSPALTAANYPTAVSDLTPDVSSEGGRPPRTQFWAQDLTERHEKRHARHHQREARTGLKAALKWLGKQTATTGPEVSTLLQTMQQKITAYVIANAIGLPGELVAYADGVSSYKARAKAIKAKGDKGGYP